MTCQRFFIPPMVACILGLIDPGACLAGGGADIEFFRERVEIRVSESIAGGYDIHVRGYYYFRNRTRFYAERKLYYPFPDHEGASYPGDIRVIEYPGLMEGETIPVRILKSGVSFPIEIGPSSTLLIWVDYRQHTEIARGVYITTTTSAWKKALELAEFIVRLPKSLSLMEISYPVEHVKKDDSGTTIDIRFHDFMPEEDLILRWKAVNKDIDLKP